MKKMLKKYSVWLVIMIWLSFGTIADAAAAPEDYLNDIVDGINSAVDHYIFGNDSTEPVPEIPTEETEPQLSDPTEFYDDTDYYDDYDENDDEYATELPTEEVTEETTESDFSLDDEPDENYQDYDYEPPTEESTLVYEPEILTETYTDPPFLERFAITDDGEGNVFVALGLWLSILSGIIIVISVLIATHRRKKGH